VCVSGQECIYPNYIAPAPPAGSLNRMGVLSTPFQLDHQLAPSRGHAHLEPIPSPAVLGFIGLVLLTPFGLKVHPDPALGHKVAVVVAESLLHIAPNPLYALFV